MFAAIGSISRVVVKSCAGLETLADSANIYANMVKIDAMKELAEAKAKAGDLVTLKREMAELGIDIS